MDLGVESLPARDAVLREIVVFAAIHDPTPDFRARWGTDYAACAMDLWGGLLRSFRKGAALPTGNSDELLMCLSYDIAVGPYSSVPTIQTLCFHQWLLQGLRASLT